jgi:hypothetical protein
MFFLVFQNSGMKIISLGEQKLRLSCLMFSHLSPQSHAKKQSA